MHVFRTPAACVVVFLVSFVALLLRPGLSSALDYSLPVNLSRTPGLSWLGYVKAIENRVYVVWSESGPTSVRLALRESPDYGETFGPVRYVIDERKTEHTARSGRFTLWADGTRLFLGWLAAFDDERYYVTLSVYESESQTLRPPRHFSEESDLSAQPYISADEDRVYVAWLSRSPQAPEQQAIRLTWADKKSVREFTDPEELFLHHVPSWPSLLMASDKGSLLLCWTARTEDGEVLRVARSTNHGLSFGVPVDLVTLPRSIRPHKLIVQDSQIILAWLDAAPDGRWRFSITTSSDNGRSFRRPQQLTDRALSMVSVASVGEATIYAVWIEDRKRAPMILFARSDDSGASFSAPSVVFRSSGGLVQFARLYADRERLLVVWKAEERQAVHKSDIFYSTSSDGGRTFSPSRNLSNSVGNSTLPTVDLSGPYLYAVWADDSPGNFDIFFSRVRP